MNPFLRWCRFNLVGAMGMAVQLSALALLNRLAPRHYLVAAGTAVELAVIHNFLWHIRYTWRDRRGVGPPAAQFLRFQLSNGLVSLLGNVVLMRVFVRGAHLPILAANIAAIICCSALNFTLGHRWAFATHSVPHSSRLCLTR